ncbi:hypothetical protein CYLTODRAFT_416390 [Cylindrobasidium torrendii FP15055 ss-10]|uniref:RING-type E3 ubiquitin transferase (cysteine targeting) n=1 Tax=Cylindrobasidium torrendii FP15055 ss-10 TaxID=1314674 RepID=A0A0D7BWU9_9AGAR|nr:hypothetical protein CYLTODRAFT_416390 [Cylindrobasidium torrendii FP15055 ss-10]
MSAWEAAWDAAQPRLSALRTALSGYDNHRTPAPINRVVQLDAEILDQELVSVLQEPLNRSLVLIDEGWKGKFEPELTFLIHAALYKLSVWNSGASYGAKLQDLRYTVKGKGTSGPLTPSGLPRRVLLIHGALTLLAPYLHTRLRAYGLSHAWPDAPASDIRRRTWDFLVACESSYTALSLANFVAFLSNGRFRTLADRILQLQLAPSRPQVQRDVSYEFMNRQMVWHAFTEFLLFLLPLINARKLRRRFNKLTAALVSLPSQIIPGQSSRKDSAALPTLGKYHALGQDQCAICAETAALNLNLADDVNVFSAPRDGPEGEPPAFPVTNPYITSCGHIYCYACIAARLMDEDSEAGWECLRCMTVVKEADRYIPGKRYQGDRDDSEASDFGADGSSEYEFSSEFGENTTDLSGSFTSSAFGRFDRMSDDE